MQIDMDSEEGRRLNVEEPMLWHERRRKMVTPEEFWAGFRREGACLIWTGKLAGGYGTVRHNGRAWGTHVLAWTFTHGPVPAGKYVCHDCPGGDNRACGNPDHLWLGTARENWHDAIVKGTGVPIMERLARSEEWEPA